MKITLYACPPSSSSRRVLGALALKHADYEYIEVDLIGGAHKTDSYRKVNGQQLVPTLFVDGVKYTQSFAMVDLLDSILEGPRLIPASGPERGKALEIVNIIGCDVHVAQGRKLAGWLAGQGVDEAVTQKLAVHINAEGLAGCELMLQDFAGRAGTFCIGSTPTIADLWLYPQILNARRIGVDFTNMPTLVQVEAACAAHPAFSYVPPASKAS